MYSVSSYTVGLIYEFWLQMLWQYIKVGHNLFLPLTPKFIIHSHCHFSFHANGPVKLEKCLMKQDNMCLLNHVKFNNFSQTFIEINYYLIT